MTDHFLYTLHAGTYKTLAHPRPLKAIDRLRDGEMPVTALAEAMSITQPNLSQHLTLMRQKGIVATRRDRLNVYYPLTSPKIVKGCDLVGEISLEHLEASVELARG